MAHRPDRIDRTNPIFVYFRDEVDLALGEKMGLTDYQDSRDYIAGLMTRFLHQDAQWSIRNAEGDPVETVSEMLMEGDVRFRARSFGREHEVHQFIGDLMLFWSGLFPEGFPKLNQERLLGLDPVRQGSSSYGIAASFNHAPYDEHAGVFRKLSADFELYRVGLGIVRKKIGNIHLG